MGINQTYPFLHEEDSMSGLDVVVLLVLLRLKESFIPVSDHPTYPYPPMSFHPCLPPLESTS